MGVQSDGEEECSDRKRKYKKMTGSSDEDKYNIYFKSNYTRLFLENNSTINYTVYVESKEKEKLGNQNPIKLTHLFTENAKGIISVYRINAYKIGITFQKAAAANSFLKLENFLTNNKLRAFIPAHLVEKVGIIKYVPTDISNEDIYKNLTCDADVISIKRFMKRDTTRKLIPMTTVAITFSTSQLPKFVFLNLFRYQVHSYVHPLIQCYKCLKFNHSAKACRGAQMCSSCAGAHLYKECTSEIITCLNCGGNHLAISRDCPIKLKKIEEKRSLILNQNRTFASVVSKVDDKNFPDLKTNVNEKSVNNSLGHQKHTMTCTNVLTTNKKDVPNKQMDIQEIINNEIIINAIVKSLVALANSTGKEAVTLNKIKDIFLKNLI